MSDDYQLSMQLQNDQLANHFMCAARKQAPDAASVEITHQVKTRSQSEL